MTLSFSPKPRYSCPSDSAKLREILGIPDKSKNKCCNGGYNSGYNNVASSGFSSFTCQGYSSSINFK
jgi:hypothetical protein